MITPTILSIAGSDCSGHAGIQADIKTCTQLKCHIATVVTVVTAQNKVSVDNCFVLPSSMVKQQLAAILSESEISVIKISMFGSIENVFALLSVLEKYKRIKIIIDPVITSTSGYIFLNARLLACLKKYFFHKVYLLTPNLDEASKILDEKITSVIQMKKAAQLIAKKYAANVLITGGHLELEQGTDVLYQIQTESVSTFPCETRFSTNLRGSGCILSTGIACFIALNNSLEDSITKAKKFLMKNFKA